MKIDFNISDFEENDIKIKLKKNLPDIKFRISKTNIINDNNLSKKEYNNILKLLNIKK